MRGGSLISFSFSLSSSLYQCRDSHTTYGSSVSSHNILKSPGDGVISVWVHSRCFVNYIIFVLYLRIRARKMRGKNEKERG